MVGEADPGPGLETLIALSQNLPKPQSSEWPRTFPKTQAYCRAIFPSFGSP